MRPLTYLILAALMGLQAPQVDIVVPAGSAITVQRLGTPPGNLSQVRAALLPYRVVLTNNSDRDIVGLAVTWTPEGGQPYGVQSESFGSTTRSPVVPAKGQANVSVVKIDAERTLLNKATNAAPKLIQRHTYYLADDGRQRHESTQMDNGKVFIDITLWAEHKKIMLDPQTKRADVLPAVMPAMPPTGRMGRMVVPQSQTDLGTRIVHGLTLHGGLFMMPYPQGTMRSEVWDYRGEVQSPNFPPVIVETVWDDPMTTEEERIVDVSNVQVLASMFEVPADFVQTNGIGDGAGKGLPVKAIETRLLDQLAAAEAKWAVNKPKAYEFGIDFRLGSVVRLTRPGLEWPVFHVENGTASLMRGDPGLGSAGDIYDTVDKQLAFIRSKLAKQFYRVEIEYDSIYGYPKHVYMKMFAQAIDDEYGFDVTGFTVVAR